MEYNSGSNRASNFESREADLKLRARLLPELYDTKSCYQLIVSITKCENLSLAIFINVRERSQSICIKVTGPVSFIHFSFPVKVTIFLLILIGYHVLCSYISLASGICYLIFTGSLPIRFDLSDYKLLVIEQFWS